MKNLITGLCVGLVVGVGQAQAQPEAIGWEYDLTAVEGVTVTHFEAYLGGEWVNVGLTPYPDRVPATYYVVVPEPRATFFVRACMADPGTGFTPCSQIASTPRPAAPDGLTIRKLAIPPDAPSPVVIPVSANTRDLPVVRDVFEVTIYDDETDEMDVLEVTADELLPVLRNVPAGQAVEIEVFR